MNIVDSTNKILQSKYTFLLISLILYIIVIPYLQGTTLLRILALWPMLLISVAIIFAVPQRKAYVIFFIILVLLCISFSTVYIIFHGKFFRGLNALGFILLSSASIYSFLKEILHQETVTLDIIIGSICVYMFIGIFYAFVFSLIELAHPGSFHNTHTHTPPTTSEFLYFSYITITTLGYGDIISTSTYSKSFVIFESISGVFYIAIFVSRLVSAMAMKAK